MKKHKLLILCVLVICITFFIKSYERYTILHRPQILPPLSIMIDDTLYIFDSNSTNQILIEPTGTIKDIVIGEIPTENEQSNFGELGMDYWLVSPDPQDDNSGSDNILYVKYNDTIYLLKVWEGAMHIKSAV